MAQPRVAIRLGTEGKDQVVRDFKSVGDAGDAAANRAARSFDRASQDIESAVRRQAAAADKLAALAPQSAMQARIMSATHWSINECFFILSFSAPAVFMKHRVSWPV